MEHFLFYAMGLSFVSFLSIILTKPPTELPPYQIPQPSPELEEITVGQVRAQSETPRMTPSPAPLSPMQDIIEMAVCHPSLGSSGKMAGWSKERANQSLRMS